MTSPRVLVVFYSRSGNTERLAFEIARDVGKLGLLCDVEPLEESVRRRHGVLGYLRTGRDALVGRRAKLRPLRRDPSQYDLVVLGTPVWADSVSTPARTFLEEHRGALKNVAVFVTHGGTGRKRVLDQIARLSAREPVADLAIRNRDLVSASHHAAVQELVVRLANNLGVLPQVVATPRQPDAPVPFAS